MEVGEKLTKRQNGKMNVKQSETRAVKRKQESQLKKRLCVLKRKAVRWRVRRRVRMLRGKDKR